MSILNDIWHGLKQVPGTLGKVAEDQYNRFNRIEEAGTRFLEGAGSLPDALNSLLSNPTFLYAILALGGVVVLSTVLK